VVIIRVPLRLSILGGGLDFPYVYESGGARFVSAAISKYIWVLINDRVGSGVIVKYRHFEEAESIYEIDHPIIRETGISLGLDSYKDGIEIATLADVVSGTGLGSSGAFGVALQLGFRKLLGRDPSLQMCAMSAYEVERKKLGESVGVQDHFIAAFGGFSRFTVDQEGVVKVQKNYLDKRIVDSLEKSVVLAYSGLARKSTDVLRHQEATYRSSQDTSINRVDKLREVADQMESALLGGSVSEYGVLLNDHWKAKRTSGGGMTNERIDGIYELGMSNGAIGGKLVGAGGGGYVMFVCNDAEKLRATLSKHSIEILEFSFVNHGVSLMDHEVVSRP
jgi:D-glycero-alpha-D-manno-heptose-7-phosphate kinase